MIIFGGIAFIFLGTISFLYIIYSFLRMFNVLKGKLIFKKQLYINNNYKYYIDLWTYEWEGDFPGKELRIQIYDSNKKKIYYNEENFYKWKNRYNEFIEYNFQKYWKVAQEELNNQNIIQSIKTLDYLKI